ncbi:MAG: TrmH family RNA methyltransferase [Oscillospiraceae bacterium]
MERITSRQNPLCVHLRRLAASRSCREQTREFFCDSPKLLREAAQWGAEVLAVLYTEGTALPPLPDTVRTAEVTESVMRSVSPMETPQGVVFSCRMRESAPPKELTGRHYLVLDGVQDPGNVGTILRTADAFDCDGLFLLPGCADVYNPKTLRSAMGVLFRRSVWRCELSELSALLERADIPLYGAALREDTADVREVDLSRAAVAVGSEGRGLSDEVLRHCNRTVKIPMSPRCESLNAAAAAAVLLWEMYR